MTADRSFPVLRSHLPRGTTCPRSVPWSLVEPHAAQAKTNHSQTLERLAERGGLSPAELWCLVHDKSLSELPKETMVAWLVDLAAEAAS